MADLVLVEVERGSVPECQNTATESCDNPPTLETVDELSISDLPREVMEIIFEQLDSVDRKRIKRVCKGWQRIVLGIRKFQTHLKIAAPSYFSHRQFCEYWSTGLRHLVKPDLEFLHFRTHRIPDTLEIFPSSSNPLIKKYGIYEIVATLRDAGADLTKVDIVFTDCTVHCPLGREYRYNLPTNSRKIRIIRSNCIASGDWFRGSSLYFEELWFDSPDKMSKQLVELYLSELGPLTKEHSIVLRRFKRHLASSGEPDLTRIQYLANRIPQLIEYVDGYDWMEALVTITRGGNVSSHTAGILNKLLWTLH